MTEITIALIAAAILLASHFRTLANISADRSVKASVAGYGVGIILMVIASVMAFS